MEKAEKRAADSAMIRSGSREPFLSKSSAELCGFIPPDGVAQPIALAGFQDNIYRSFLLHKAVGGQPVTKALAWFLSPEPRVEVQSQTLVLASGALSRTFFGEYNRQQRIVIEGIDLYGKALRSLRDDLCHPVKAHAFETLGATIALYLFEVCLYMLRQSSSR